MTTIRAIQSPCGSTRAGPDPAERGERRSGLSPLAGPDPAARGKHSSGHRLRQWIFRLLLVLAGPASISAQERPPVTPGDYGRWESLGGSSLSPFGDWIAYSVSRVDETSELRVRRIDEDSTRVFPWASGPRFSPDGRWLAWTTGVSPDEEEALRGRDEPVRRTASVMDLRSGDIREFEAVAGLAFNATGRFIALRGYPPSEPSGKGADLRVVDLVAEEVNAVANVAENAWSPAGALLAMAIATGSDLGNGVQLYDAEAGTLRSIDASGSSYQGLRWRDDSADLAVMRSRGDASEEGDAADVLAWRGLDRGAGVEVLGGEVAGLPDSLEVVRQRTPVWSDDGAMISVGVRPVEEKDGEGGEGEEEEGEQEEGDGEGGEEDEGEGNEDEGESAAGPGEEPELPNMQLWHTKDVDLYPAQKLSERFNAGRTLLAVWHLDENRLAVLGSGLDAGTRLLQGWDHALEQNDEPYPWGAMFGRPYRDYSVVDVKTGERRQIFERMRYAWPSTGGGWMVTWDGSAYRSLNLETGESYDLTSALDADFGNSEYDTPTDVTPPRGFGPAAWLEHDAALLLYDKHDIWRIEPDGSNPARLTRGAESGVTHRLARVLPDDDEPGIDPRSRPWLSLHNDATEQRGYARFDPGWESAETLLLEDASVSGLTRADSADVMMYRSQAFDDPPDLFVAAPGLAGAAQVTEINPFISEVAWGRAELVDFVSESGRDLQFTLLYPADYVEGTAVPTIVYTYEILTPQIHSFRVPTERDYYNYTAWTQHGYAVLLPDIVYTAREPGVSAIESVRAAVAKAVEMGVADADAVGLIGHSWGGYQATYLPTRTDIFAASVAGAPLTDFVSFMGQIHWGGGVAEVSHWETGQGRMEVPFWEDPEAHRRNSPIHEVHNMETPLLMAFGDDDGVVDWDQGTEFYNFARRAGKQMVLLVYEGEGHGFREEANQKDYTRRILEWFGHYLKGEPAPAWITNGIPAEELEEEKKRVAKGGK